MKSPSAHVLDLQTRIAQLQAKTGKLWQKAREAKIDRLTIELKAWQILAAKDEATSLQTFGEQTGLQQMADQQKRDAAKAAKQAREFQATVAALTRQANDANAAAQASQAQAMQTLATAQDQANAHVDPMWKSPYVIGGVVILGLAVAGSLASRR